jgi:hypothetical protein
MLLQFKKHKLIEDFIIEKEKMTFKNSIRK